MLNKGGKFHTHRWSTKKLWFEKVVKFYVPTCPDFTDPVTYSILCKHVPSWAAGYLNKNMIDSLKYIPLYYNSKSLSHFISDIRFQNWLFMLVPYFYCSNIENVIWLAIGTWKWPMANCYFVLCQSIKFPAKPPPPSHRFTYFTYKLGTLNSQFAPVPGILSVGLFVMQTWTLVLKLNIVTKIFQQTLFVYSIHYNKRHIHNKV